MGASVQSTRRGARQVRAVLLVSALVVTGSSASAMAVDKAPNGRGNPGPAVTSPVADGDIDAWLPGAALSDGSDLDIAPMVDPVEDVDESDVNGLDMAPMVDPVEDVDESDPDELDMAPMVDPVEDVDESDLVG